MIFLYRRTKVTRYFVRKATCDSVDGERGGGIGGVGGESIESDTVTICAIFGA